MAVTSLPKTFADLVAVAVVTRGFRYPVASIEIVVDQAAVVVQFGVRALVLIMLIAFCPAYWHF